MRGVFTILFVLICSFASGSTYFVAVNGNDNDPGTISRPWKTWEKAFTSEMVQPGDTVFFRGGVYPISVINGSGYQVTRSGTSNAWIHYYAYPADFNSGNLPVLDCGNALANGANHNFVGENFRNIGIYAYAISYVHFKGLTVKNVFQRRTSSAPYDAPTYGWLMTDCIAKLENCTVHDIHGTAFRADHWTDRYGIDNSEISFINCDAFNCCDYFTDTAPDWGRGGHGTGFSCYTELSSDGSTYVTGCRAWNCSDQGFSIGSDCYVIVNNCWSFNNNAYLNGEGNGFKMGWVDNHYDENTILKVSNCLAAFNDGWGFHTNDEGHPVVGYMNIFNNTSYKNGLWGFHIFNTAAANSSELHRVFKNNLSYGNSRGEIGVNPDAQYTHDHNSWDLNVSITASDFITLDSTGLTGPRNQDGSLPLLGFLHLAGGSDLINVGTDVGLPFNGSFPDLGAFESLGNENEIVKVTKITLSAIGGSASISSPDVPLQLIAAVLPSNATNKSVTWSISNLTGKASINSTGLVTGISSGKVVAKASANDGSGISGTLEIEIANPIVRVTGINVLSSNGYNIISSEKGTLQLTANVLPSNASDKSVSWFVENITGRASVSSTGLVTASSGGNVTVTATANDGSGISGSISLFINTSPVIVLNSQPVNYSGFVCELNANGTYDPNKDNLKYEWIVPSYVSVSTTAGPIIKFLAPDFTNSQNIEFTIKVFDGKTTQVKTIPVKILPYMTELEEAEIVYVEASSFQQPFTPSNVSDKNYNTFWAVNGEFQWIVLELKRPFEIQYVKLAFQPNQKTESFFDVEGSNDKLTWEPILVKTSSCGFSGNPQIFNLPESKTSREFKFIRITGKGNSKDSWNYISEVQIFGSPSRLPRSYEDSPVKIYPNPAEKFINIRIDESGISPDVVRIVDLSGKIVMSSNFDPGIKQLLLPLILKKGLYVIELCSENLILFAQKLVVN